MLHAGKTLECLNTQPLTSYSRHSTYMGGPVQFLVKRCRDTNMFEQSYMKILFKMDAIIRAICTHF